MSKLKAEAQKAELLNEMNRDRGRYLIEQVSYGQQRRARGVSSTEGALLNSLFSVAMGGRVPALLRRPVQALALSWLKSRFDKLVHKSRAPRQTDQQKLLFDVNAVAARQSDALDADVIAEPVHVEAVNDLRRVCNQLNLAIQEDRQDEIERLSNVLREQIVVTRDVLQTAASLPDTKLDQAVGWVGNTARTKPWAAVGAGAGIGYLAGMAVAIARRIGARREARQRHALALRQEALTRELVALRNHKALRRY